MIALRNVSLKVHPVCHVTGDHVGQRPHGVPRPPGPLTHLGIVIETVKTFNKPPRQYQFSIYGNRAVKERVFTSCSAQNNFHKCNGFA